MTGIDTTGKTALVAGASRAIGLALTGELLQRGWNVVATVRNHQSEALRELEQQSKRRLTIEHLDITDQPQITALRERLDDTTLDLLFVNAGTTNKDQPIAEVSTDDFITVMVTNALGPMRVVEGLSSLVAPSGTVAVMSSRQGSVSMNEKGGHEAYRASKSALNQLMRSYAARHRADPRTLLLMHPGWVKTDLGGPGAQLSIEDSVHGVVNVLERHTGEGGLQFLNYLDQVVPW
jgi:NAD(P)-dependent dehydrogenase (short-subunit alcohol dehydrogenase family)